ncbi:transcriptional regulator [Dactylosporangium sp. AC04546]|uniref:helix-turn-helix domain-containing protein n=1 Tax=Dactylosporangium sp. AC04546 TaxID=2862460 RepID=UPI001EE0B3AD|nr:helix-turn-helix domain-containing protein [Dactylosporangium sp. AC04546]WVK82982.1 transcriptional regulator [Dactylosporangium sp. AC04546]
MPDPWLALRTGADPLERIRLNGRAWDGFLTAGAIGDQVRGVVADSWRRSAAARLDPDATAPVELTDAELEEYREAHPLRRTLPLVRDLLGAIAEDGDHLMAICDERGRLLWVEGHPAVLRQAERMNFVPGARWDESHAGTNAPGTAVAVDHAVQIFATEHFSRRVHRWTCSAAPIHDPHTGRLLGAIDVTGGDHLANPHSLALVRATARAAEAHLATAAPPATVTFTGLGRDEAMLTVHGRARKLSRRHSELLVLLLQHPEGCTGEQLGLDLYGDELLNPVTLRAELSRLRRLVGPALLDSRPYRIREIVSADFQGVLDRLARGDAGGALAAYRGPLLPASEAPGIVRLRRLVEGQLRAGVRAAGDPALLTAWTGSSWGGDDLWMWEALAAALPAGSPRLPLVLDRIARLAAEFGATSLQRRRR